MASISRASAPSTEGIRLSSALSTIPAARDNAFGRSTSVDTHVPRSISPLVFAGMEARLPSGGFHSAAHTVARPRQRLYTELQLLPQAPCSAKMVNLLM